VNGVDPVRRDGPPRDRWKPSIRPPLPPREPSRRWLWGFGSPAGRLADPRDHGCGGGPVDAYL